MKDGVVDDSLRGVDIQFIICAVYLLLGMGMDFNSLSEICINFCHFSNIFESVGFKKCKNIRTPIRSFELYNERSKPTQNISYVLYIHWQYGTKNDGN